MAEAFGIVVRICTTHGIAIPDESDIKHLIDSNKFLLAANALRANMGDEKWLEFLSEIFDRPSAPLTDFHRLLFRIPFAAAATTNYETLLERGFKESKLDEPVTVFTQVDHEQLGKALGSKRFFVLKAHGTIERPDTIVLTQKDYARLIHNSVGYRTFLKALFLDRTILFLGFGLNDPELQLLLEELREIFDGKGPIHYALFDVTGTTATEQKNFESHYGIQILPYTPSTANHPEVLEFLKQVLTKLPKYILSHTMNIAIKPAKEVLDSDSHYRLVMNSDNEFSIREKYEGASKDHPLKFTVGFEFDKRKETDREAHRALQKLLTDGEAVTIKSPQLKKFVPPEILLPLMPDKITQMEITIGPVKAEKPLVVRAIMEPQEGPTATLDNIALKKIRGGTEKAILTNEDQEVPWKLTQEISFNESRSNIQLNFSMADVPIKQALKMERFWEALSRGGYLTIEIEKSDAQIGRSKVERGVFDEPDAQMIQILEALETIQSKTGVTFTSPAAVSGVEAANIVTIAQIVTTGLATMKPTEMNFTVREVEEVVPKLASGAKITLEQYIDEWVSNVLGKRISLGPVFISCKTLQVTSEEHRRAMTKIAGRSADDIISVVLTPAEGSTIDAKYIAWLPEADADVVRNLPIVRKSSLNTLMKVLLDAALDTTGSLDIDEFMSLLREAEAQMANQEVVISPLSLATDDDLARVFNSIVDAAKAEQRSMLRAKLVENGWLRDERGGSESKAADAPI